jgi:hypothetical protein
MPKKTENAKGARNKGRVRAKKNPVPRGNRILGPEEAAILAEAQETLKRPRERKKNSDSYRWAKLVIQRYESGRSIANAKSWLGAIMAGGIDPEYLE